MPSCACWSGFSGTKRLSIAIFFGPLANVYFVISLNQFALSFLLFQYSVMIRCVVFCKFVLYIFWNNF